MSGRSPAPIAAARPRCSTPAGCRRRQSDPWGVRVVPENGKVRFETYRIKHGRGPNGEDPNTATVNRGTGQCVHCKQAIDGDEIKRQARGESPHGTWKDRLYAVVAVRLEPKLDSPGKPRRYTSGAREGEIKTTKIRYFRPPNETRPRGPGRGGTNGWRELGRWDAAGLIPTESIDKDSNDDRAPPDVRHDSLVRHVHTAPASWTCHPHRGPEPLTPEILAELGEERGRAVVTYLQFAIDKGTRLQQPPDPVGLHAWRRKRHLRPARFLAQVDLRRDDLRRTQLRCRLGLSPKSSMPTRGSQSCGARAHQDQGCSRR